MGNELATVAAHRNGHQLVQRLQIPAMPELPARAAGAEIACRCGEVLTAQRTATAFLYYCGRCSWEYSEPAPRLPPKPRPVPKKRCACSRSCRFCGGVR